MRDKVLVIATAKHPNRVEGEEYLLTAGLLSSLVERGFVVEKAAEKVADPMLPKAVKIVKPKEKAEKVKPKTTKK